MRIAVDRSRCSGIGNCEAVADDYFEVLDDGSMKASDVDVPATDLPRIHDAVSGCPARALKLVDEQA